MRITTHGRESYPVDREPRSGGTTAAVTRGNSKRHEAFRRTAVSDGTPQRNIRTPPNSHDDTTACDARLRFSTYIVVFIARTNHVNRRSACSYTRTRRQSTDSKSLCCLRTTWRVRFFFLYRLRSSYVLYTVVLKTFQPDLTLFLNPSQMYCGEHTRCLRARIVKTTLRSGRWYRHSNVEHRY